ncbi:hypothetical protein BIV57_02600 [Mangrovactinospora gilvigrisea]|uniref:Uncharacterized protein n=1 Tax=Mangrovactinospora gilvigrisea TaxID=1428644 RepID=A0A1J7BK05_9ACTN|nr:hypothetical protein [Mangrovactinospora gilvigrisea]OIV39015.1 hypothetical protein BIV57_02600 [Mangrovactinospora gilvigrisea]
MQRTSSALAPTAENATRIAEGMVRHAVVRRRLHLDYTSQSLRLVDRMIEAMRWQGPSVEVIAPTLTALGCYIGEVLVRQGGGAWVDFGPVDWQRFRQPMGVRMPDGQLWNPVGKAFKRFENGPTDSLVDFCFRATGRWH